MPKVLFSKKSRRDLLGIWRWISKSSGDERADEVVSRIERRVSVLEEHAFAGPARPDINAEARMLVAERWVILYSVMADQVRIVRILDGASDIKKRVAD